MVASLIGSGTITGESSRGSGTSGFIQLRALVFLWLLTAIHSYLSAQNPLWIPDTLSGNEFDLNVQAGVKTFFPGESTPTFGYNGSFLGPTLFMQQGEQVKINVTNGLSQPTTVHWHGFHVPARFDGGPHQIILPGETWTPEFTVLNSAATYWYHPHGEGKTEIQISKGLAGLIIVRDSAEATYNLPRSYGIDDFPLIVQTKAFDILYQIATATHEDAVVMVNGTTESFLMVPQQVVRFRLLAAAADRTFNFGLSDNDTFYVIASDGGLLSRPHPATRIRLSTSERAEILIDFSGYPVGEQVYLKSFASELERGIIGADSVGTSTLVIQEGYYSNPLNGADFDIIRFDVGPPTASPVTVVPGSFDPVEPINPSLANVFRDLRFSPDTVIGGQQGYVSGPFQINGKSFHIDSVDQIVWLNSVEVWTLTNETLVAHPIHIHDIQFFVTEINGSPPPPEYAGYKDVILVKPDDTVRIVMQFTTFADSTVPYMFHCHLLHHEDDGMMGTFLVLDSAWTSGLQWPQPPRLFRAFPNPTGGVVSFEPDDELRITSFEVFDMFGNRLLTGPGIPFGVLNIDLSQFPDGLYLVRLMSEGQHVQTLGIVRQGD